MIRYDPAKPWTSAPAGGPQPGLTNLLAYLIAHYGGSNNGIYVNRPMRGSSHPSLHRDGRACDWLQPDMAQRDAAFQWLIANAEPLQVQAVHYYERAIAWRPSEGVHQVPHDSTGWGQSWADWLHVERNLVGSADLRPISEILHVETPPPPPTPKDDDMPRLVQRQTGSQIASTDGIFRNDLGPTELAAFKKVWPDVPAPVTIPDAAFDALVLNSTLPK